MTGIKALDIALPSACRKPNQTDFAEGSKKVNASLSLERDNPRAKSHILEREADSLYEEEGSLLQNHKHDGQAIMDTQM